MTNDKPRHEEIAAAARASFGRLGLDPLAVKPDRYDSIRLLLDDIVTETDCTRETARRNIHRILREQDGYQWATWGGKRPGAGRKTNKEKAMSAKIINTNTGKEIEFKGVDDARKYAAADETTWPCDIVDDDGNVIEHFG
jgi:hypothetical protein